MPDMRIRKLTVRGFRGIDNLSWHPTSGVNLIIGGGDAGKTTILESIGLLFYPGSHFNLTESDYYHRRVNDGFRIEAVLSVSDDFDFSSGEKTYWPWEWRDNDIQAPLANSDAPQEYQQPVYRVSFEASSDFESSWQVCQPDGSFTHFPVGLRRKIGLVKLSGDDKNDRDLRLVYGSALDRLISTNNLRSKISAVVSQLSIHDQLDDDSKEALSRLDKQMADAALPSSVSLGIAGSQGISIGALIGLFAKSNETLLPLTSWGAGTRRMTSLRVAAVKPTDARLTLVDEIERGLEPYKLRQFLRELQESKQQVFVTTHSPIAVAASSESQLWYVDAECSIGRLDRQKIRSQQTRDPETFLSKVAVIVEGETEQGFVGELFRRVLGANPLDYGIRICLGQGDDQLLELLEEMQKAKLVVCGFADNDGAKEVRWATIRTAMGDCMFQWKKGCIESNLLSLIPIEEIEKLLQDSDDQWDGYRLRTIADRVGTDAKEFSSLLAALGGCRETLKRHIIHAATGDTSDIALPDGAGKKQIARAWKKHARSWYKNADGSGGRELLQLMIDTHKWQHVEPILRPFVNAVLKLIGKPSVERIEL